jgi:hypothetical protein
VIGYHEIDLAPSPLVIELDGVKTQRSIQTIFKRPLTVSWSQTSGADTHLAVEDCRVQSLPLIPGQPDQSLKVLLDILVGYQASLQN